MTKKKISSRIPAAKAAVKAKPVAATKTRPVDVAKAKPVVAPKTKPKPVAALKGLPSSPVPSKRETAVRKPATKRKTAQSDAVDLALTSTLPDKALHAPHPNPIFQIHFEASQRSKLDPDFIPFDNAGHDGPLREFDVFERLSKEEGVKVAPLWGAVSWRFAEKTGLSCKKLEQMIAAHPGYDLYYCNPAAEAEAVYANFWQQGLTVHPGFQEICEGVFEAAGLDANQLSAITPSSIFSSSNFFVGSQQFWAAYLPFIRGIVDKANARLPKSMRKLLDSSLADPRNLHAGASYWPFIIERLLPVFLRGPGANLKTHKIALPDSEARMNSHLRRLREMKDVAHRTRSQWLYSCWLHYRNLYLLQTAGRDWCVRYLPQLTPTEVAFW